MDTWTIFAQIWANKKEFSWKKGLFQFQVHIYINHSWEKCPTDGWFYGNLHRAWVQKTTLDREEQWQRYDKETIWFSFFCQLYRWPMTIIGLFTLIICTTSNLTWRSPGASKQDWVTKSSQKGFGLSIWQGNFLQ